MRVLKRQTLTVGGRTTYMSRGGAGKPHVHLAASDLRPAPALLPFGARNGNGCSAPSCTFPIYARPTVLPEVGGGGIIMATLKSRQPALRLDLVVEPGGG